MSLSEFSQKSAVCTWVGSLCIPHCCFLTCLYTLHHTVQCYVHRSPGANTIHNTVWLGSRDLCLGCFVINLGAHISQCHYISNPILLNIRPNIRTNSHEKSDLYQTRDPKISDFSKNHRFFKIVTAVRLDKRL